MKSTAERRELIVHIDDDADATVGEKVENRCDTLILTHQAMAVTNGIDADYKVKGSEEGILGDSQPRGRVCDEVFVSGHAKLHFFILLRRKVLACFAVGGCDESFRKVRAVSVVQRYSRAVQRGNQMQKVHATTTPELP